jgi:hypothetical protein
MLQCIPMVGLTTSVKRADIVDSDHGQADASVTKPLILGELEAAVR